MTRTENTNSQRVETGNWRERTIALSQRVTPSQISVALLMSSRKFKRQLSLDEFPAYAHPCIRRGSSLSKLVFFQQESNTYVMYKDASNIVRPWPQTPEAHFKANPTTTEAHFKAKRVFQSAHYIKLLGSFVNLS